MPTCEARPRMSISGGRDPHLDVPLYGLVILVLVVLSALFSGAESAIQSLRRSRIKVMLDGDRVPKLLRLWPEDRLLVLTTILIGNNLVNITAASLATFWVESTFQGTGVWGVSLAIGVMTFVILTFGEIIPKSYAISHAETYVRWFLPILTPFYFLTYFFARAMTRFTRVLLNRFGSPKRNPLTEEELRYLLSLSHSEGSLDETKKQMVDAIFEFHDTVAKEIMIPRTDIVAFDINTDPKEIVKTVRRDMFSRYPVYEENVDSIIGVFYAKALLLVLPESEVKDISLRKLLRDPYYIPDSKNISELFRELQRKKLHMAIVVDEFGGTAGIVTMEDIVEEIFGEIYDEFDDQEDQIKTLGEGRYLADARIPIRDLGEVLDLEFPDQGEYETLGGFILLNAGKVPEKDATIEWNGLSFTVRACDSKSIQRVEINRIQ